MTPAGTIVFRAGGRSMAPNYVVTAFLWALLSVLIFALLVVLFMPGPDLSGSERAVSSVVLLVLATPLALQLRSQNRRMRDVSGNFIALDANGVRIRLAGSYRAAKGLPEIADRQLQWNQIAKVTREQRKFTYPSLIPMAYPLDVFTLVTAGGPIAFTKECIPEARRAAREIAARSGISATDL